jgi:hypothetical protein
VAQALATDRQQRAAMQVRRRHCCRKALRRLSHLPCLPGRGVLPAVSVYNKAPQCAQLRACPDTGGWQAVRPGGRVHTHIAGP